MSSSLALHAPVSRSTPSSWDKSRNAYYVNKLQTTNYFYKKNILFCPYVQFAFIHRMCLETYIVTSFSQEFFFHLLMTFCCCVARFIMNFLVLFFQVWIVRCVVVPDNLLLQGTYMLFVAMHTFKSCLFPYWLYAIFITIPGGYCSFHTVFMILISTNAIIWFSVLFSMVNFMVGRGSSSLSLSFVSSSLPWVYFIKISPMYLIYVWALFLSMGLFCIPASALCSLPNQKTKAMPLSSWIFIYSI